MPTSIQTPSPAGFYSRLAVSLVFSAVLSIGAMAQNLLTDKAVPRATPGSPGWTFNRGSAKIGIESQFLPSADASGTGTLFIKAAPSSDSGYNVWWFQDAACTPGTFELSFEGKSTGEEHKASVLVEYMDANSKHQHRNLVIVADTQRIVDNKRVTESWKGWTAKFDIPEGVQKLRLRFGLLGKGSSEAWYKNIHLSPASSPPTPSSAAVSDNIAGDWKLYRPSNTPESATGISQQDSSGNQILILRKTATDAQDAHFWWTHSRSGQGGEIWKIRYEARAWPLNDDGGEYNVYAGVGFTDSTGKWISFTTLETIARHSVRWPNASKPAVPEWKHFESNFTLPPNTGNFGIRLGLGATGAAEAGFRNIIIEKASTTVSATLESLPNQIPVFKIAATPVSANGVTLTPDWTLDGAPVIHSATRARVPLNALWAIQPTDAITAKPRAGNWAFFKVPGYFNKQAYSVYGQEKTSWASLDVYSGIDGLWYVRDVEIPTLPSPSPPSNIYFEVGGMWGYAVRAYWNGQPIGIIMNQLQGQLLLPAEARPGDRGQLALYALRVNPESQAAYRPDLVRSHNTKTSGKAPSDWSKGFHDLYLSIEPRESYASNVKITPSVRTNSLNIRLTSSTSSQQASYHVTLRDATTQDVLNRKLGAGGSANVEISRQLSLSSSSDTPTLLPWTPETPNLYSAVIQVRSNTDNSLLDETLPIPFGFREVWVDGRELKLNGQPLRIRPRITLLMFADNASIRRQMSFLKDMGFNCLIRPQAGGGHQFEGGARTSADAMFSIADELGMMIIPYLPYSVVNGGQFAGDTIPESDLQALVDYTAKHQLNRFYNHPSIIAWSGFGFSPSQGGNPLSIDPAAWGITPFHRPGALDPYFADATAQAPALRRLNSSRAFVTAVKNIDPSRPFLSHNDAGQGDGWGYFDYLNWTPVQEWEDWPRQWAEKGIMPIGSTEHGLPYPGSFVNHAPVGGDTEPWVTEYTAMLQGAVAYSRENPAYSEYVHKTYDPNVKTFSKNLRNPAHQSGRNVVMLSSDNVQPVWAGHNKAIYRTWRTYGVPMGIEPFGACDFYIRSETLLKGDGSVVASPSINLKTVGAKADRWTPRGYWLSETMLNYPETPTGRPPPAEMLLPLGTALVANNSPLLAYIAGSPERFAAKDHAFYTGETISKQIALVWDGFSPRPLELRWRATLDGKEIASRTLTLTLAPGEIRFQPLVFTAPAKAGSNGLITLEVRDPSSSKSGKSHDISSDQFVFQVHAKPSLPPALRAARMALYDPAGESGTMFKKLGLSPAVVTELKRIPSDAALLVIGRRSLGTLSSDWLKQIPSKIPVLFLEQTEANLTRLGFRTYPMRSRQLFTLPGGSPLLPAGLSDTDLADWRVNPTLLPSSTTPLRDGYNFVNGYQGTLASITIETPVLGNFTPHLQNGFDLRETALLQTEMEGHRILFCQLSLPEAVGPDPVATRIAVSLLENLLVPPTSVANSPLVVLETEGQARSLLPLARKLGASSAKKIQALPPANSTDIVLSHGIPTEPGAFRDWLTAGGKTLAIVSANDKRTLAQVRGLIPDLDISTSNDTAFDFQAPIANNIGTDYNSATTGLGLNDLHARQQLPTVVFDKKSPIIEWRIGKGHLVLLGLDPRDVDTQTAPWLRLTQSHRYRILSQLLTNMGTELSRPSSSLFAGLSGPASQISIDDATVDRIRLTAASEALGKNEDWVQNTFNDSSAPWTAYDLKTKQTPHSRTLLRITFRSPKALPPGPLFLDLGTIDDFDEAWLNGTKIGFTTPENTSEKSWSVRRLYLIPENTLMPGAENVIAISLWNRNADTKGWKAWLRGPVSIHPASVPSSPLYVGDHKRSDDPYIQYHW